MELAAATVPDKVKLVGEALGIAFDGSETTAEIGKQVADACRALMKAVEIKTMKESGFDRDVILSGTSFVTACDLRFTAPFEITDEAAEAILTKAYDDYA
jgi:alcohol dehydrogenase class IV